MGRQRKVSLPKKRCLLPEQTCEHLGKKTLVLDMDNTLISSSIYKGSHDFEVMIDMKRPLYVTKRPGLDRFLQEMAAVFELVIFTASPACYANQVIDQLDPEKKLILHRLFLDSCTEVWYKDKYEDGVYVKDLSILGRDLKKVILVDDCKDNFSNNPANGIPIKFFENDPSDEELAKLSLFLSTLTPLKDVRDVLTRKLFK